MQHWHKRATEIYEQHRCGRIKLGRLLAKEDIHISDRTLGRWMQRQGYRGDTGPSGNEIQTEYGQKTGQVTTRSATIQTLEQALEASNVDTDTWGVDKYIINSWADKCQVKVWLRRKVDEPQQKALAALIDRLIAADLPAPVRAIEPADDPHMLEISLFDHHFGKLAWSAETGSDYDLKIAERLFSAAVDRLLQKTSGYQIDKILFPIGQDFFHINNPEGTTKKGTRQDTDSRLAKIFEAGQMAVLNAIERARQVADVEVIWVPGNHDPETSYYLAKVVEARYWSDNAVTVDASPQSRKFCRYGVNLIGFTHGDKEPAKELPIIMAGSVPELWALSKHREWHLGHFHKRKETTTLCGDSYGPVHVRWLPSLCGTDAWHYESGYVNGQRAAEAYLWSKQWGYSGHFSVNERELT